MSSRTLRNLLIAFLVLLVPIAWLATRFAPYDIDGDAVNYMDIASYLHAHNWHATVNSYWHPLYPAFLAAGQMLFHPTRWNELGAYYTVNFVIFLLEAAAIWAFVTALVSLRTRLASQTTDLVAGAPLLSLNALRFLALGLLVVASQRELSMNFVRPDALLQALMLAAFAAMLATLASDSLWAAPLVGVFFGLAYLTKSFAFAVSVLTIAVMLGFGLWAQRRSLKWALAAGLLAVFPLGLIAGPYVTALSHKMHRLDFGDSGALNFAWYVGNTEKMHLEPSMTDQFGTATVHLQHPEQQLMASPGVYSYRAVPYGTYPDWFDTSYFNERVQPHIKPSLLLHRDVRNVVLVVRYILNHPEAPILFALLLCLGASLTFRGFPRNSFWLPVLLLGLAMWFIYGLVNIEERYVTLAWLVVVLPLFAMLRTRSNESQSGAPRLASETWVSTTAAALIVLFAFLALGESLRTALERRRLEPAGVPAWQDPNIFAAAHALTALGLQPGDDIACMGTKACLYDFYWARLAQLRITDEIYAPDNNHLLQAWQNLPNHDQAAAALRTQGDKVLVAYFNPGEPATESATQLGWRQLGETGYYALPLTLTLPPAPPIPAQPWVAHNKGNQ
jgi:hypothetical protein